MAKFDLENVIAWAIARLKLDLTAKLLEIDAEKNDGISLTAVSDSAYFTSMNESAANFNPFILIDEVDTASEGIGPQTIKTHQLDVAIIITDDGQDLNVMKRAHRYRRALEEVFESAWDKIGHGLKLEVSGFSVVSLNLVGSSGPSKITGVSLKVVRV